MKYNMTYRACFTMLNKTILVLILSNFSALAFAAPFIDANNRWLRSDIQTLADNHIIKAPITQWPIMWASIGDDLDNQVLDEIPEELLRPFKRVIKAYTLATKTTVQNSIDISLANQNAIFTEFADTQREKVQQKITTDIVGDKIAVRLSGSRVINAYDGQDYRLDGSYLGYIWGNWALSVGSVNRWWGPAWKSAHILSSNARPIPSFSIQRNRSTPFESSWLRWIGPWTFETFLGQLENDRAIANAKIWGARFTFKPLESLEIGFNRTAIWAGRGRPKDLKTFYNLFIGNDNIGQDLSRADEPSNQQAGMDLRWHMSSAGVPASFYMQYIGEDKLIKLIPSKATTAYGFETEAFFHHWGSIRGYVEYSNTATSGFLSIRTRNTSYEHSLYRSGYRYHGRVLGASWDNDSVVWSAGIIASNYANQELAISYSNMDLNRDNTSQVAPGGNSVTKTNLKVNTVDIRHRYYFKKSYIDTTVNIKDKNINAFDVSGKYRIGLSYHLEF